MIRLWFLWHLGGWRIFYVTKEYSAGLKLEPRDWPHAKALVGHYFKRGFHIEDMAR